MAAPSHRRSLRKRRTLAVSAAVVAAGAGAGVFVRNANAGAVDLYHQTLAAKDGRAASGTGATGGAKADSAHTFTVSTRAQLVKALGSSTVNWTPTLTAGPESSAQNLPAEPATTTGAGLLT